jgi:hypothetical protein
VLALALFSAFLLLSQAAVQSSPVAAPASYEFNDSHFHLTNYVQEGTDLRDFLKIMGTRLDQ